MGHPTLLGEGKESVPGGDTPQTLEDPEALLFTLCHRDGYTFFKPGWMCITAQRAEILDTNVYRSSAELVKNANPWPPPPGTLL